MIQTISNWFAKRIAKKKILEELETFDKIKVLNDELYSVDSLPEFFLFFDIDGIKVKYVTFEDSFSYKNFDKANDFIKSLYFDIRAEKDFYILAKKFSNEK